MMDEGALAPAERITTQQLFDQLEPRLGWTWVAGRKGGDRAIESGERQERRPSFAGYLNIIYPNRIQIVGREELRYLDGLDAEQRAKTLATIIDYQPAALLVTRNQAVPADLLAAAEASSTPVLVCAMRGHEVLTYLQYHLARALARMVILHGVFLEVYSIGVLLTGDAGVGKSELALELITRGHGLVADDAPEFRLIAPEVIDGTCPAMLRDMLEVRGLGVLNVREMFGHTAVKRNKYLRLIVALKRFRDIDGGDGMQRLTGITGSRNVLDVAIPEITVPVASGRNLAVLAETAVRHFLLKTQGHDPAKTFIDRQAHALRRERGW